LHRIGGFQDESMIGELDYKETRGMLFVLNQVKTRTMLVGRVGCAATMEIRNATIR
jgi:hypothetical protein